MRINVKKTAHKVISLMLALVMLIGIIPLGLMEQVFAAPLGQFTVSLPEEVPTATVTLTNAVDEDDTMSVEAKNSQAVFADRFVDSEKTYNLSVTGMDAYRDYLRSGIQPEGNNLVVALDQLEGKETQTLTITPPEGFNAKANYQKDADAAAFTVTGDKTDAAGEIAMTSSNSDAVRVSKADNGSFLVEIVGAGDATLTARRAADGKYLAAEAEYAIQVSPIYFEEASISLTVWDTAVKKASYAPNVSDGKVTYKSSNDKVVTVDKNGKITAKDVGDGTAITITATYAPNRGGPGNPGTKYSNNEAQYAVYVSKNPQPIRYDGVGDKAPAATMTYGDDACVPLTLWMAPNAKSEQITYSSSNDKVATVDEKTGEVTVLSAGQTDITASYAGDGYFLDSTASYTLTVEKKTIKLDFGKLEKEYGQDDPDLAPVVRNVVDAGLLEADKGLLDTICGYITATYEGTDTENDPKGNDREPGTYDVELTVSDEAKTIANYGLEICKNTLHVKDIRPTEEKNYTVSGIDYQSDKDAWGKEITITAENGYQVSKTWYNKGFTDSITFSEACNCEDHVFYIRANEKGSKRESVTVRFGIDKQAPEIVGFDFHEPSSAEKFLNYLTFGLFGNRNAEVTVSVSDIGSDSRHPAPSSGLESVTLYTVENPEAADDASQGRKMYGTADVKDGKATFTLKMTDFDSPLYLAARAVDHVGNTSGVTYANAKNSNYDEKSDAKIQVLLEDTKPTIETTVPTPVYTDSEGHNWYPGDVEFKAMFTDAQSGLARAWVQVNSDKDHSNLVNIGYDGKTGDFSDVFIMNDSEKKGNGDVSWTTADAVRNNPDDGAYNTVVHVWDNAGNESTDSFTVYIDRLNPEITGFQFGDGGKWPLDGVEKTDYGFFFKEDTTVTVTAADASPSSGINEILFKLKSINAPEEEFKLSPQIDKDGKVFATYTIEAGFKGQIYASVTDNVGHFQSDSNGDRTYSSPSGVVVELPEAHDESAEGTGITLPETNYSDIRGNNLYKTESVPVTLTVVDTISGIAQIKWSVNAPFDAQEQAGETVTIDYQDTAGLTKGSTLGEWTVDEMDGNLVTKMSRVVNVTSNSNDIVVSLNFTDNAGNTFEKDQTATLSIDRTAPTIGISYDNNSADSGYANIYKANRTATITITERNFDPDKVEIKLTNTDGVIPQVVGWKEITVAEGENPDGTKHQATVLFAEDGDYTLTVNSLDKADNKAEQVENAFTIDKTPAVVSVAYDNNDARNGNYYNAQRIATITVVEHNFDPSRIVITGTAADPEAAPAFPALVGVLNWSTSQEHGKDTHVATITYSADARYTFDVAFTDMAGNLTDNYPGDEFYVDTKAPVVQIVGVTNTGAYNGDVAPIITATDTNYDFGRDVAISLTAANKDGLLDYLKTVAAAERGQTVTYSNFKVEQVVDDIYTLTASATDMAGNTSAPVTVVFSVNRFGSVYDLSQLQDINGKYVKSVGDIVFTETNVDPLDHSSILLKLYKNGTPADLVEGKDYTVAETGGSGLWSRYTYTINKNLFTDDARYSITVYSVDKASNINENIDESKEAEISFGVDKTSPVIVPIDLENGMQYPVPGRDVSIEIKDNLLLEGVTIYLNGEKVEYTESMGTYTFHVPESNSKQSLRVAVVDAAGNEQEIVVDGFLVSTNIFARWYNNTALFWGSLSGVAVVAIGAIWLIVAGKKKKKETGTK